MREACDICGKLKNQVTNYKGDLERPSVVKGRGIAACPNCAKKYLTTEVRFRVRAANGWIYTAVATATADYQ